MEWDLTTAGTVYYECMAVIRRHSNAYDYAMGRADYATAHQMIYELQPVAGWYALAGIDVDYVLGDAVGSDDGEWEDFPEARELASEAADYVAESWESDTSDAHRLAVERFAELARERGIPLVAKP